MRQSKAINVAGNIVYVQNAHWPLPNGETICCFEAVDPNQVMFGQNGQQPVAVSGSRPIVFHFKKTWFYNGPNACRKSVPVGPKSYFFDEIEPGLGGSGFFEDLRVATAQNDTYLPVTGQNLGDISDPQDGAVIPRVQVV